VFDVAAAAAAADDADTVVAGEAEEGRRAPRPRSKDGSPLFIRSRRVGLSCPRRLRVKKEVQRTVSVCVQLATGEPRNSKIVVGRFANILELFHTERETEQHTKSILSVVCMVLIVR
jgi:hypothetical protein